MGGIHKTDIDWADSSWNPVTGCLHGCKYCYAARIAQRFEPHPSEWPEPNTVKKAKHDPRCYVATKPTVLRDADGKYLRSTPYPKGFAPTIHTYKLGHLRTAKAPRRIFVGSMTDLFGDWVPDEWLGAIFRECYDAPQHVYMFLTKNPKRYVALAESGLLPEGDNYWYGTTLTGSGNEYLRYTGRHSFISIEPLLGEFHAVDMWGKVGWVIIGAMTGPAARKFKPEREWIEGTVANCQRANVPVFMKNSIAPYWKGSLLQEYPDKMMAHLERKPQIDWKALDAHKVYVESVRDAKRCHACYSDIQGKPAWRLSARYYICTDCYEKSEAKPGTIKRPAGDARYGD